LKGTLGDAKCVTEILRVRQHKEVRGDEINNVLMFMSKMLQNAPASIFNSEIFPGRIPWATVKNGKGGRRGGKGEGEVAFSEWMDVYPRSIMLSAALKKLLKKTYNTDVVETVNYVLDSICHMARSLLDAIERL